MNIFEEHIQRRSVEVLKDEDDVSCFANMLYMRIKLHGL